MIEQGRLKAKYSKLEGARRDVLDRAERAAKVTIPHICPPEGHTENSSLPDPYQGLGARAVNTLSAKIQLALFPPNTAFFKVGLDQLAQASMQDASGEQLAEANNMLALYETIAIEKLEETKLRSVSAMNIKHLIVTGNGCIRIDREGKFKFYSLKHYVVERDPEGDVMFGIIKENISPETLDESVREHVLSESQKQLYENDPWESVELYTVMTREGNRYKVWQEINDTVLPGSEGSYPLDAPLFLFLRWTAVTGENYGRGLVDEYYGDFRALDDLSRDLLDASSAAAKVIFLLDPNSFISQRKLAEAKSGDILKGRSEDVSTVGLDKLQDFQITLERMRDIRQEITDAFLMHSSVQRNAERVTAEEIRFMAQELEDALGGVYSVLAQELQLPLATRWLKILSDKELLPPLPSEGVHMTITTGLDALGRGHEIARIDGMLRQAGELLGPEQMQDWINPSALLARLAAGWGVPKADFINDPQQVQQMQQQRAMQQMAQEAAPGVAQEAMRQQGQ